MEIRESFEAHAPVEAVWRLCADVERVARCMPGVESVTPLGGDRYRVVVHQKIGFVSVALDLTIELQAREPNRSIAFAASGKSIAGAVATVRSKTRLDFDCERDGGTRVQVTAQVFVDGMLGALGHKAILAKSREITEKFALGLRDAIQAHSPTTSADP